MYTTKNFKTKKALREAVKAGETVRIFQPGGFFDPPEAASDFTGTASVEGPHYPQPHTWYATVTVVDGVVTKVK